MWDKIQMAILWIIVASLVAVVYACAAEGLEQLNKSGLL